MTKMINIFLASAGSLKEERKKIEMELSRRNDTLVKQGLYIELKTWEKASTSLSGDRIQNRFNEMVLESDIFICLIYDRLGIFTEEEFIVAHNSFLRGQKPRKIFVYFKNVPIEPMKLNEDFKKVLEFRETMQKKYEQFCHSYKNHEDLILIINKELEEYIRKLRRASGGIQQ